MSVVLHAHTGSRPDLPDQIPQALLILIAGLRQDLLHEFQALRQLFRHCLRKDLKGQAEVVLIFRISVDRWLYSDASGIDIHLLRQFLIGILLCIHHAHHGSQHTEERQLLFFHIADVEEQAQVRDPVRIHPAVIYRNPGNLLLHALPVLYILFDIVARQPGQTIHQCLRRRSLLIIH